MQVDITIFKFNNLKYLIAQLWLQQFMTTKIEKPTIILAHDEIVLIIKIVIILS